MACTWAMVALGSTEAMNEHIKCSFCGLLWSGHERVSMRVYMHVVSEAVGVKGGVHKERAVCILDVVAPYHVHEEPQNKTSYVFVLWPLRHKEE